VGWILDLDGCIRGLYDVAMTTLKVIPSLFIETNIFQQSRQDNKEKGGVVKNKLVRSSKPTVPYFVD